MRATGFFSSLLMRISAQNLVAELGIVRRAVVGAFNEDTWAATRNRLLTLGHQRDFELFGRPIPPEGAA